MTYVIANIHGEYERFKALLSAIKLREQDVLYILGDLCDYGEGTMELIEDLSVRLNVFCIAGEHDFLAARMLGGYERMQKGDTPDPAFAEEMGEWIRGGGMITMEAYRAMDADAREGVLEYLEDMTLYEEIEAGGKEYLLLHAGIADFEEGDDPADFLPGDFFSEDNLEPPTIKGKTVVVGHIPTESGSIEYKDGYIRIDCGVANGGRLACLCLENGKEYYA